MNHGFIIFFCKNSVLVHAKTTTSYDTVENALMQQVMQGKDGGWKAKAFLESMKKSSPGFDYPMKLDENGRSPVALMWITPTMRKSWIRYGNVMFIDMMKRKMNDLHWPYVSLVGIDHKK
jgi:hypothetical protein